MTERKPPAEVFSLSVPPLEYIVLLSVRHFPSTQPSGYLDLVSSKLTLDVGDEDLFHAAESRGLTHAVACVYGKNARLSKADSPFVQFQRVAKAVSAIQIEAYHALYAALEPSGIQVMVPKGLSYLEHIYPPGVTPLMGDVDILVRPEDLKHVCRVLRDLGYSQDLVIRRGTLARLKTDLIPHLESDPERFGQLWPYSKMIAVPELSPMHNYIKTYLWRRQFVVEDGKVWFQLSFDTHYSFNNFSDGNPTNGRPEAEEFWKGSLAGRLGKGILKTLSPTTLSWVLPYHFYHEVMGGGAMSWKVLADLAAVVRTGQVDETELQRVSDRYPYVRPALYYVYRFLSEFAGLGLPPAVAMTLSKPVDNPGADFGDFLPRLLNRVVLFRIEGGAEYRPPRDCT